VLKNTGIVVYVITKCKLQKNTGSAYIKSNILYDVWNIVRYVYQ